MWYLVYNGLLLLASPIILLVLLAKKRCRRGLLQRFGLESPSRVSGRPNTPDRPVIWVHAVSLGEVMAVVPLVKELHRRHPDHRFLVSTVTETGREAVEQRLADVAEHRYAPLDFSWVVNKVIGRWQPSLYIFVETELWPNLLRALRRERVPTVLVNGRLSSKSYARQQWGPVRSFYRTMLQMVSLCLMQSDRDVERMVSLGADARLVRRTGNIKFDQPMPELSSPGLSRSQLGVQDHEQLLVAGSTHPVEEDALVTAYRRIVTVCPSAVLLIAPRHIERVGQVEAMIREQGFPVQRRSAFQKNVAVPGTGPRVVILDTRGELPSVYREAAVAFVGGTLVPIGGHNLLEPAVWGKPVLFGPYTDHCAEVADLLTQGAGGVRVADVEALTEQVTRLLNNAIVRERMGQAARKVIQQNQGALQRTIEALETVFGQNRDGSGSSRERRAVPLMVGQ